MKIRVYLSGPITGLSEEEYTRRFATAERHYEAAGYEVVNPVTLSKALLEEKPDAEYEDFMQKDLEALKICTHIALLEGWEQSKGANREKEEAEKLGLGIMEFKELRKAN